MIVVALCRFRQLHSTRIIVFYPGFPAFRHADPLSSSRIRYSLPDLIEVGQSKKHLELLIVLLDASVARLLEAELSFDYPKGMFHLGSQVSFCRLNQILQPSLRRIG